MAPEITTWTVYYLSEYNTSDNVICYNLGSPTTFSTSTVADMYQEIQGSTPTKDGFVFGGWCLESQYNDDVKVDVSNKLFYNIYSDTTSNHTFRFVAIWRSATPTTIFNSTIGTFSDNTTTKSVQTNLDGTVSLSALVEFPIKQSYVFKGWSTTENGSVVYTPYATPTITEDTTLYAVWVKAESYLISEETLVGVANSIRAKEGTADKILATDFASRISSLPSGVKIVEGTITSHCSGKYHYGDITFDSEPKILLFGFSDPRYSGTISAGCFSYSEFKFILTPASNPICCFYQRQGGGSDDYSMYEISSNEHVTGSGVYTNLYLYKNYSMEPDATPTAFWYKAYFWD